MTQRLSLNSVAPDFELQDADFTPVKLSKFRGRKNIVLVFLRGFVCPFCRSQLAQLQQDYYEFQRRDAEIITIGPDGPHTFKRYWMENNIHFIGLTDYKSQVAEKYGQEADMFELGRLPVIFIVDKQGKIQYTYYSEAMSDIPNNLDLLQALDHINLTE